MFKCEFLLTFLMNNLSLDEFVDICIVSFVENVKLLTLRVSSDFLSHEFMKRKFIYIFVF